MCLCTSNCSVKTEEDDTTISKREKSKKAKGKEKDSGDTKEGRRTPTASNGPPLVSVAAIVGGMSAQKQRRILNRGVDILVATPGRLWDILEDVSAYFPL